jgi:DNA polymerase III epsilon subunit-like protein
VIKKKCYVDIETTGLEPSGPVGTRGVILSAGFVLETGEEFEVVIMPSEQDWKDANSVALQVNGITKEFLLKRGVEPDIAFKSIAVWLMEHGVSEANGWVFFGQNPSFDRKFILFYMKEYLSWIDAPRRWVDMIPYFKKLGPILKLDTTRQNTHHISQQLGVPEEPKPHQAIEGAKAVKRNYEALQRLAKEKGTGADWV